MDYSYESHKLESKEIPFIFHSCLSGGMRSFFNWHREVEFLYVTNGSGVFVSDAHSFELSVGDIFAINSNSIHTTTSEKELTYMCIIVDSQFCLENGIEIDDIIFENKISDTEAVRLYEKIADEFAHRDQYSTAAIRCSVLSFLVYLARNHSCSDNTEGKKIGKKSIENMRNAIDYIRQHFTERLTLDDISASVGLSRCHFAREFKKLMGITPVGYINMLRCETAMKMLRGGKHTVGEIQLSCGFDNASYFTKVFKKHFGKTPMSFIPD